MRHGDDLAPASEGETRVMPLRAHPTIELIGEAAERLRGDSNVADPSGRHQL
jgi:hypothetical protein